MLIKGYFSKEITDLLAEKIDIKTEVINNLRRGNCVTEDIFNHIEARYEEFNGDIDFDKYIYVDESSVMLDKEDTQYLNELSFVTDCNFDIERFAKDNGLVEKSEIEFDY